MVLRKFYVRLVFFATLWVLVGSGLNSSISPINRPFSAASEWIVADHTVINYTRFDLIPESVINTTKSTLHIAYEHTSHGTQICDGMSGLPDFKEANGGSAGLYDWNDGLLENALDLDDDGMGGYATYADDLGYTNWALATQLYLEDEANADVNVIMWSWCGQVGGYSTYEAMYDWYLGPMTTLENSFPDVEFVYMTGHTDGNGLTGDVHIANEIIREYCQNHSKILFDFADIESYDPDGNYFGDKNVDDFCSYTGGNWAIEWQESHEEGVEWYSCSSAHSQPLNANLKAYAAWWLWARLSGWNSPPTSSTTDTTTPSTFHIPFASTICILGIMATTLIPHIIKIKKSMRKK